MLCVGHYYLWHHKENFEETDTTWNLCFFFLIPWAQMFLCPLMMMIMSCHGFYWFQRMFIRIWVDNLFVVAAWLHGKLHHCRDPNWSWLDLYDSLILRKQVRLSLGWLRCRNWGQVPTKSRTEYLHKLKQWCIILVLQLVHYYVVIRVINVLTVKLKH